MAKFTTWMGALFAAGLVTGGIWVTAAGSAQAADPAPSPAVTPMVPNSVPLQIDTPEAPAIKSFPTANMFSDTFRSTHIARGVLNSATFPAADVTLSFTPIEYIKGAPLAKATVELVTGFNGDLRQYAGRECVCAFIVRDDGTAGLTHGMSSFTAADWGITATTGFYRDILAVNTGEYAEIIATAAEEHPANFKYNYPAEVKQQYADALVRTLAKTGTHAAWQAGNELAQNPTFADGVLNPSQLFQIAQAAVNSVPGARDRGYAYILLTRNHSNALGLGECMALVKDEIKNINLDHLATYMHQAFEEAEVTALLSEMMTNRLSPENQKGYNDHIRGNAIITAAQFGSRQVLPALHQLLGHETTRRCKVEVLNAFRYLHDPSNFKPLNNYLNGGDATTAKNVQTDYLDSVSLHKRTLVAIAAIDSKDSNQMIQDAYDSTRVVELKQFIRPLLEQNKAWRAMVNQLPSEGDVSFYELDKRYQEIGIIEKRQ
jgi:hypothetical protein